MLGKRFKAAFHLLTAPAKHVENYLHNVAVVTLDDGANALLGGVRDETISTRAQIAADEGKAWGKGMTKFLHIFQKNHGKRAMASEKKAAQREITRIEAVEQTEKDALEGK